MDIKKSALRIANALGIKDQFDPRKIEVIQKILDSGLGDTLKQVQGLRAEQKNLLIHELKSFAKIKIYVRSATPLSDDALDVLCKEVRRKTDKECEIEQIIDKKLIGGVIIETNQGIKIDKTLKNALSKIVINQE